MCGSKMREEEWGLGSCGAVGVHDGLEFEHAGKMESEIQRPCGRGRWEFVREKRAEGDE